MTLASSLGVEAGWHRGETQAIETLVTLRPKSQPSATAVLQAMTAGNVERILIVEDDEKRRRWFQKQFARHECDETLDVSVAVQWLAQRDYTLIFLDHDLAEEHYALEMADDGLTGYSVAAWLAAHPERQKQAQIIIHSLNYRGAQRMLECLQNAGRTAEHVPFPYLPWLF